MGSTADSQESVPPLGLVDRFIDEPRPLRVAVIGGGLSGITAGILLPAKVPNIQLTIFEKNEELSGTWLENKYPGVRCDIPSHAYQSTFSPKPDWSDVFSYGDEIRDYWQSVARKYGVYELVQLGHRVVSLDWNDAQAVWRVTAEAVRSGAISTSSFDAVITAVGRFNNWKLPDYPGISEFKGHLRHVQDWDPSFDPSGKRVAVIGNGATGIQLVTNLQKKVARLDHYARSKTWIASSWAGDERLPVPQPYSKEDIETFKKDPNAYLAFRQNIESRYWRRFHTYFRGTNSSEELRAEFTKVMRQRASKKPELLKDLIPDFSPNCRRLTPGPGYIEALTEDNVDYIRTPILRFTATGIETTDGVIREVDAVFCATGADQKNLPSFPIRAHGTDIATIWGPKTTDGGAGHGHPYTYFGTATPGFPNLFFLMGPNGSGNSGTVPYNTETQLAFLARILRKISREGIRSISPSADAADEFEEYAEAFFAKTVFSESCSSWYNGGKPGGFISGIWPGSASHLAIVRLNPRWEDWEYTYVTHQEGRKQNRFAYYLGKGITKQESDPKSNMAPYLHIPGTVDLKDLHEAWHRVP